MQPTNTFTIRFSLFFLTFFSLSFASFAADLQLKFTSQYAREGQLFVELYQLGTAVDEGYQWQDIQSVNSHIFTFSQAEEQNVYTLNNLPQEPFCIRAFLDLNNNQKLDRSAMGIPKEPVGLANNPPLMFGEPSPDTACVQLLETTNTQHIHLREKKPKK